MKKIIYIPLLLMAILVLSAQPGKSVQRTFFDNTLDFNTNYFKFNDYTCTTASNDCYFVISVKVNTLTERLTVIDAKDLFIQIKVSNQDPSSKIINFNIADVYLEQVINGGRFGGSAFDQSSAFIMSDQLPQITSTIPYNYHVGLDGCSWDACNEYREKGDNYRHGSWFTNLQINMEIQLYIDIPNTDPNNSTFFRYQEYIYNPLDGNLNSIVTQATQAPVPGFGIGIIITTFVLLTILFSKKRKQ